MISHFDMIDLGLMSYFLGIEVLKQIMAYLLRRRNMHMTY